MDNDFYRMMLDKDSVKSALTSILPRLESLRGVKIDGVVIAVNAKKERADDLPDLDEF